MAQFYVKINTRVRILKLLNFLLDKECPEDNGASMFRV